MHSLAIIPAPAASAPLAVLPDPDHTDLVIRVRHYGANTYVATTPQQGVFRTCGTEQGFERTADIFLDRHFPGAHGGCVRIDPADPRVLALGIKPDRHSADAKEERWYLARVQIAD